MAAIKATVGELAKPGTYERLFDLGDYLRKGLNAIIAQRGLQAQAVGFGSVWLIYFFEGEFKEYRDLLKNDDTTDMQFRRALLSHRHVFQPLPLKRLYLSLSHDRMVVDQTLDIIDSIMSDLAHSYRAS
jgi:glutamate-1-semialdehyde 2,1-aminomutase